MVNPAVEIPPRAYSLEARVLDADVDVLGHMSNIAYVRLVQEIAIAHAAALGFDPLWFVDHAAAFVVRRHAIEYLTPAPPGAELRLSTWISKWGAATCDRETAIAHASTGAVFARATTTWAYVLMPAGRPTRVPIELRDAFPAA